MVRPDQDMVRRRVVVSFCQANADGVDVEWVEPSTAYSGQGTVLDRCLQLHGGYGYMEEYPIARAWRDGRPQRIYGGTNDHERHHRPGRADSREAPCLTS